MFERRQQVTTWALWFCGVLLFPIGASIVPRNPVYAVPPVFFNGTRGCVVWLIWAVAFALMMLALRRLSDASPAHAIVALAIGGSIVAFSPALDSHDPYAYLLYGEMAAHGVSPWSPSKIPLWNDVVAQGVRPWGNPAVPCVYGPVFVAAEALLVTAFRNAATYQLLILQRFIALGSAIAIALLNRGRQRALWALHPLVMFEAALGGHNDLLMLLFLAVAARMRSPLVSGLSIAAAGCVKIVGLVAIVFRRRVAIGAAIGVILALILDRNSLGIIQLHQHQLLPPLNSPIMLVRAVFTHVLHLSEQTGTFTAKVTIWTLACFALFAVTRKYRRSNSTLIAALIVAAVPIIYPCYFLWPLFAATTFANRRFAGAIALICALSFVLDIPAFISPAFALEYGATVFVFIALGSYLLLPQEWRAALRVPRFARFGIVDE